MSIKSARTARLIATIAALLAIAMTCCLFTAREASATNLSGAGTATQATSSPTLNSKSISMKAGTTTKLSVAGGTGAVTWKSSNKKVATITKAGKVTAKKAGTTIITATKGGKKLACSVTVAKKTSKTLVAYFSHSGTTKAAASKVKVVPAAAYTAEDLDYNTEGTRATVEARDASARPELASAPSIPAGCDTVYLGYPIWWGDAASPLRTYVERADLSGKTVIPFCTSGGSDIPTSVATLSSLAPDATWKPGRRFLAGASDSDITSWADGQ